MRDVSGGELTINAFTDGVRKSHHTVHGRLTVENTNIIGEVVEDAQVVFYDDDVVIRAKKALYAKENRKDSSQRSATDTEGDLLG